MTASSRHKYGRRTRLLKFFSITRFPPSTHLFGVGPRRRYLGGGGWGCLTNAPQLTQQSSPSLHWCFSSLLHLNHCFRPPSYFSHEHSPVINRVYNPNSEPFNGFDSDSESLRKIGIQVITNPIYTFKKIPNIFTQMFLPHFLALNLSFPSYLD